MFNGCAKEQHMSDGKPFEDYCENPCDNSNPYGQFNSK